MQIDQPLLITVVGGLAGAIVTLFWLVIKSKDAYIAYLQETIRYQRGVGNLAQGTAHRAVDLVGRLG